MPFSLMPLPYAKTALEPVMSAETLDYHHGKHHAAYAKKVGELVAEKAALKEASLVEVIRAAKKAGDRTLFNNSAQCPSSRHLAQIGAWISGERASSGG